MLASRAIEDRAGTSGAGVRGFEVALGGGDAWWRRRQTRGPGRPRLARCLRPVRRPRARSTKSLRHRTASPARLCPAGPAGAAPYCCTQRSPAVKIWKAVLQRTGTLCLCLLALSCATPRSARELEDVGAVGEIFYEEHRHHECGSIITGFTCVHRCGSFLFKYWRAQGSFEENVNVLQSNLVELGFNPVPTDFGKTTVVLQP